MLGADANAPGGVIGVDTAQVVVGVRRLEEGGDEWLYHVDLCIQAKPWVRHQALPPGEDVKHVAYWDFKWWAGQVSIMRVSLQYPALWSMINKI